MTEGQSNGTVDAVELKIPASASYLRLARLAAADVAARAGWTYEEIDALAGKIVAEVSKRTGGVLRA